MQIVFIGAADTEAEAKHIEELRAEGHSVYVPSLYSIEYETAGQRIVVADEIHIWLSPGLVTGAAMSFYLGMAYMFEWSQLSEPLSYDVKVFNERAISDGSVLAGIIKKRHETEELSDGVDKDTD